MATLDGALQGGPHNIYICCFTVEDMDRQPLLQHRLGYLRRLYSNSMSETCTFTSAQQLFFFQLQLL